VKITIQTNMGPHDISPAYETAVRGLVAHRALDAPEWWALTHLASGMHFHVDMPRLKDVRRCVRLTADTAGDVCWAKPLKTTGGSLMKPALSRDQRRWAVRYQGFADRVGQSRRTR
jgi:hypothetical protein